jgi:hypothetical protein
MWRVEARRAAEPPLEQRVEVDPGASGHEKGAGAEEAIAMTARGEPDPEPEEQNGTNQVHLGKPGTRAALDIPHTEP